MSEDKWNKIVSEDGEIKLIWKGEKDIVWVRMKFKGMDRWYVFEGRLEFKELEDDDE